jgi:cobalamin biosynthesis protein CobT
MESMPSLKLQTSVAMNQQNQRLEHIRKLGEAKAKALKDAEMAELAGAESTEESEDESSNDDSDSDDGSDSKSEAGSSDDVEMGGMGTPGSARKAAAPKAQKPKAKVNFSGLSKKFSKGRTGRH